jgi:hypothetical protein
MSSKKKQGLREVPHPTFSTLLALDGSPLEAGNPLAEQTLIGYRDTCRRTSQ